MDSIHVYNRTGFEDGVELYRHAETAKHHVSITVLGAECFVGDFETRGAVNGTINPGHLQNNDMLVQFSYFTSTAVSVCFPYCYVVVILWHIDKCRQTLAEPHGDLPVHVHSKGFKAFLKATRGVVLESVSIFAKVHATHL